MFAKTKYTHAFTASLLLSGLLPLQVYAQDITLTETAEPDSKAWEEPARLSFTIVNDGPDTFSGQVNLELSKLLKPTGDRSRLLGGNVIWNRESGGSDRQNNFEAGLFYKTAYSTAGMDADNSERTSANTALDWATRTGLTFARTATYADKTLPICLASPALAQCNTQFSESIRGGSTFAFFSGAFESWNKKNLAYSISPKISFDGDWLLNNPIDTSTGIIERGGFFSTKIGASLALAPKFIAPEWDFRTSFQVRQRLAVSNARRASTDKTSTLFEANLTYFVLNPPSKSENGWRAGIGLKYSKGSDPFVGKADVDQLVLSLRIGQY
jgi:hypothetical protein